RCLVLLAVPAARRVTSHIDVDARVDQAERHALRIPAVYHARALPHGGRTVKDSPAVAFYAFCCGFDSSDVEIIEPKRPGPLRRLYGHAPNRFRSNGEILVHFPRTGSGMSFFPAEKCAVIRKCPVQVGGHELVPRYTA